MVAVEDKSSSTSKSRSREEGRQNQPVPSTRPKSAPNVPSLVQTPRQRRIGGRDIAITTLSGGLTGMKLVADVTGIPFIGPIASLILFIINIRNASEMTQYQGHSAVLAERIEMMTTFLNDFGQEFPNERDLPQTLRNIFQKFESGLEGIRSELEQIKKEESSVVKRVILHKNTNRRLKQCDDKLSNLLQDFHWQTAIAMCQCTVREPCGCGLASGLASFIDCARPLPLPTPHSPQPQYVATAPQAVNVVNCRDVAPTFRTVRRRRKALRLTFSILLFPLGLFLI